MERVVVERIYETPVSDAELADLRRRAASCLQLRNVSHRTTYLSIDRLRAICVYDAPDAASVRDAHDMESIPYARIWTASETSSIDPA